MKDNKEDKDVVNLTEPVSLEWVKLLDDMASAHPPPEAQLDKMKRKFKAEPLVPIGCLLTAGCLGFGLAALRRGDSKRQQFFMRGRVLAQGFTVVAMSSYILYNLFTQDFSKQQMQTVDGGGKP